MFNGLENEKITKFYDSYTCNIAIFETCLFLDDVQNNKQYLYDITNVHNIIEVWGKSPNFSINEDFKNNTYESFFNKCYFDLDKLIDLRYLGEEIR